MTNNLEGTLANDGSGPTISGEQLKSANKLHDDAYEYRQFRPAGEKFFDEGIPRNLPYSEGKRSIEEQYPTLNGRGAQTAENYLKLIDFDKTQEHFLRNAALDHSLNTDLRDLAKFPLQHWKELDKNNQGYITSEAVKTLLKNPQIKGLERATLEYIGNNPAAICQASNDSVNNETADKLYLRDIYRFFSDLNPKPDHVAYAINANLELAKAKAIDMGKAFSQTDLNHDGKVTLGEMLKKIETDQENERRKAVDEKALRGMKNLDTNKNGSITYDEYRERGFPQIAPDDMVRSMFKENDSNGDGVITWDELHKRVEKSTGTGIREETEAAEIKAIKEFHRLDVDNNRSLTKAEFSALPFLALNERPPLPAFTQLAEPDGRDDLPSRPSRFFGPTKPGQVDVDLLWQPEKTELKAPIR